MLIRRLASLVLLACALFAQSRTPLLPIKVKNPTDVARVNEIVSVSVPFPDEIPIFDVTPLCITQGTENAPVAHQSKVLARWRGDRADTTKHLKWVQFSFPATIPANGEVTYHLSHGGSIGGQLYAQQDVNEIRVFTNGNTCFKIPRLTFAPFKEATVNGVAVVNQPGFLDVRYLNGSTPTAFPTSTVLEDYKGYNTYRTTVVQKGWVGPLAYTCRWYFTSGSSDVEMDFRLENPAAYGCFSTTIADGQQYIDKLAIVQPVVGSTFRVTTPSSALMVTPGQAWDLRQQFTTPTIATDVSTGFSFTETLAGNPVSAGRQHAGAVDLSTSTGGLTVAVDRFWQNHPKSLKILNGSIEMGLWPDFGYGPEYRGVYATPTTTNIPVDPNALNAYRFEGGRWKTHRVMWSFHNGFIPTGTVSAIAKRTASPLAAVVPGWYVRRTGALGALFRERTVTTDIGANRLDQFYKMIGDDTAADDVPNYGKIGLRGFLNRGGAFGGHDPYGWDNFGDIPWADGYSSQHYDWAGIAWNGWLRSGDYGNYDVARDLQQYRRDYGQMHSTNTAEPYRGGQFYEKGWWHGNYSFPKTSHNWLEGLLLGYILTGDEASRDAAIENVNFVLRNPPSTWDGLFGSRLAGWSVDNLVAAYNFLGNPQYLLAAEAGIARYESFEIAQGGLGYVLNTADGNTAKPWMDATMFIGAAKYTMASHSTRFLPLLERMRDAWKTTFCIAPSGPLSAMDIPKVWYQWSPTTGGMEKSVLFNWWATAVFSYSAAIFNSTDDLAWAEMYYETSVRFWQVGTSVTSLNVQDPGNYSRITMKMSSYADTESKAIGTALIWGQAFPAVKAWFSGQW